MRVVSLARDDTTRGIIIQYMHVRVIWRLHIGEVYYHCVTV